MHAEVLAPSRTQSEVKEYLDGVSDELLASLPAAGQLSASGRRGIIARYSAVLEGNFIYWMTGAYLAARSEEARSIIVENLLEEVRDSHPLMLRKFAMAANAQPNDADALAVNPNLSEVRLFIGRLSPAPIVAMMAFFESFIQRFMAYLEELAEKQGSAENEYTQVHGVCDVAHSEGLFRGLEAEMIIASDSREPADYLYEGVHLLRALIESIFTGRSSVPA
ncbi:MAG: iron-containing redox enzyme family protein [Bryobacteraceae bacterium]